MNILETISTSIQIKRTNEVFSKTGRVEDYWLVDEPYGDDDGSTSPSHNRSSKNDGRSRDSTRNARNAEKHGQYSKSGKNLKTYTMGIYDIYEHEFFTLFKYFVVYITLSLDAWG